MTWADMAKKYPEYREDMTKDRERDFVKDCFDCYEKEGFAEKFNAIFDTYKEYHGKKFTVIGRSTEDDTDLTCLPMWKIRFEDGTETAAYPEEIIPSEIKNNQP